MAADLGAAVRHRGSRVLAAVLIVSLLMLAVPDEAGAAAVDPPPSQRLQVVDLQRCEDSACRCPEHGHVCVHDSARRSKRWFLESDRHVNWNVVAPLDCCRFMLASQRWIGSGLRRCTADDLKG